MRVLYVEADAEIARSAITALQSQFEIDQLDTTRFLQIASSIDCDAVVIDLNQSPETGASLLRQVREMGLRAPIVAFNGCHTSEDRVKLLEAGADDCLIDPVSIERLVARTRRLLCRSKEHTHTLQVGDLSLDYANRKVTRSGKLIRLKPKEFAILEYLMRNAGRPVTRSMIVENVWNLLFDGLTNVVDVHVNHLRAKIDRGFEEKLIRTAYGIGYELIEPGEKVA
jgi:two-component system copper resistance phosphate regulon response regulator CusR